MGNGHRIVVAEDERAVRESLTRALTLEGYEVTAVSDGAQALEALRAEPADVVVLDVMMPVVDGLTACRVLRSEKNRVPILMVTARTETSDRVAGLDAGADDYLPKPFALDELLARLRALLRRIPGSGGGLSYAGVFVGLLRHKAWGGGIRPGLARARVARVRRFVRPPEGG